MSYMIGRDFGAGFKEHAVPADAQTAGSPRYARYEGYKATYRALCGLQVWRPVDRSYEPLPWPGLSPRRCKTCVRLVDRRSSPPPTP